MSGDSYDRRYGSRWSPRRLLAAVAAGVAACTLTAASCGGGSSPVAVGAASRGSVAEVVDVPASVTARAAATLSAPTDGTLVALRVRSGDRVRPGQVLAVIDSPTAQAQLSQAKRALATARQASAGAGGVNLVSVQAGTDQAATDAFTAARDAAGKISDPRLRAALLAQVQVAEQRYTSAAKAAGQAVRAVQRGVAGLSSAVSALGAAQRLQAQQAYDLAKSTVDALTLRAPISGVVQLGGTGAGTGSTASLNDLIEAAGTPVLTVVDTAELGLIAEVDETDVLMVTPGVTASAELDAATGATYQATVRSVDVLPTPSSRGGVSYRVRLTLGAGRYPDDRAAPTPRPGMSAVAHLRVRQAADAVTVPAQAVFTADGRDMVWAVRDGKAVQVPVTLGVQGQDTVQVVSGLAEGQQVVVRGTDQVRIGQQLP